LHYHKAPYARPCAGGPRPAAIPRGEASGCFATRLAALTRIAPPPRSAPPCRFPSDRAPNPAPASQGPQPSPAWSRSTSTGFPSPTAHLALALPRPGAHQRPYALKKNGLNIRIPCHVTYCYHSQTNTQFRGHHRCHGQKPFDLWRADTAPQTPAVVAIPVTRPGQDPTIHACTRPKCLPLERGKK
jgi:hypothetical protein